MKKDGNKYEPLEPHSLYHIYNRSNGGDLLFRGDENYEFFLKKYREYISGFAETFCYCLMPTHFHFVVRIQSVDKMILRDFQKNKPDWKSADELQNLLTRQFSNLFNCYSRSYNNRFFRHGSLFSPRYKRKLVNSTEYLLRLLPYIHQNPIHAGLCRNLDEWKYSSFGSIVTRDHSFIKSDEVIEWYGNVENFIFCQKILNDANDIDG